jgi:hypothetical protein
MKYCQYCGYKNAASALICPQCGTEDLKPAPPRPLFIGKRAFKRIFSFALQMGITVEILVFLFWLTLNYSNRENLHGGILLPFTVLLSMALALPWGLLTFGTSLLCGVFIALARRDG